MSLADRAQHEQLWFMDSRVIIRIPHSEGADGVSVIEHHLPYGDGPPLHVHHTEDEIFYLLAGRYRVRMGDREFTAGAGESFLAPKGIPHTYRVESREGARGLTIMRGGDFEGFVRALSRPAERDGLPGPAGPRTQESVDVVARAARAHGIEMVGPPLE